VRLRVLVLLLAVLVSPGLVAGCSEDKAEPATGPGLPSQADLKSYFQAITGSDLDALAAAQTEVAAAGSLAQGYAAYVAEYNIAANASDAPVDPFDVEEVDNGFKACVGDSPDQCATWTDLEGKDGKLANFTINGRKLDELLVDLRGQAPIEVPGLYSVQPEWAYRQPTSGRLYVVCMVTAIDVPISSRPGTYIEADQILKGVDDAPAPAIIKPGDSKPVVLGFEDAQDAKLDGQVTFDLKLGGQQTESIGFGLADPPA
jgi:hypothetical protein